MEIISHREMRNHSAEVLRRVEAGESLVVTNRGKQVAILSPPPSEPTTNRHQQLLLAGEIVPAQRHDWDDLPPRVEIPGISTERLLAELRGSR